MFLISLSKTQQLWPLDTLLLGQLTFSEGSVLFYCTQKRSYSTEDILINVHIFAHSTPDGTITSGLAFNLEQIGETKMAILNEIYRSLHKGSNFITNQL